MTKRRRWRINPAQACYLAVAVLFLLYAFGMPALEQSLWPHDESASFSTPGLSMLETMRSRSVITFFVCWIFFVGSAFGSFLNVIAFRMPRGESIVSSASRCPYCETPIQARDNIPVFGWLGLRGRCRACHLPIATRYPKVEAAVGFIVLWLACVELLSGGANLPGAQPHRQSGIAFTIFTPDWKLISLTLMHVVMLCMLVVWRLMEIDRSSTPHRFIGFGLFVGVGASLIDSSFHPQPWLASAPNWIAGIHPVILSMATPIAGAVAGAALGPLLFPKRASSMDRTAIMGAFSTIGTILGWQACLSIATISAIGLAALKLADRLSPRRFPVFLCAVLIHISFWKVLAESQWWPGGQGTFWGFVFAASILVGQRLVTVDDREAQSEPGDSNCSALSESETRELEVDVDAEEHESRMTSSDPPPQDSSSQ